MGVDDWLKDDASLESALQGLGAPTGASPIVGAEEILAHATSLLPVAFGAGAAGQAAAGAGAVGKVVLGWKAAVAAVGIAGSSFIGGMAVQHQLVPAVEAQPEEPAAEMENGIEDEVGIAIEPALEPEIEVEMGTEGAPAPAVEGPAVAPVLPPVAVPAPAPVVRAESPVAVPAPAPVVQVEPLLATSQGPRALSPQPAVEPSIEEPVAEEALVQQIQAWPLDKPGAPETEAVAAAPGLPTDQAPSESGTLPEDAPVAEAMDVAEEAPAVAMLDELDEESELVLADEAPTKKKKKKRKSKRRRKQAAKATVERERGTAVKNGQLGAQVFAGSMANFRQRYASAARVGAGGYWESDKETYTRAALDLTVDVYGDAGLVFVTNVGAEVGVGLGNVWGRPSVNMVVTVQDEGNDPGCYRTGPIVEDLCSAWYLGPRVRLDITDLIWTATEYRHPIGAYAHSSYSSVGLVLGVNLPPKRR